MSRFLLLIVIVASFSTIGLAQKDTAKTPSKSATATPQDVLLERAKLSIAAHGGDKLRQMKTFVVRGTVDITGAFNMVIPATFAMVIAGERYSFELNNPMSPLKQIFDGKQTYSSGYELPPVTSHGFPLLPKAGEAGYVLSEPGDPKKKGKAFRITTPNGF